MANKKTNAFQHPHQLLESALFRDFRTPSVFPAGHTLRGLWFCLPKPFGNHPPALLRKPVK